MMNAIKHLDKLIGSGFTIEEAKGSLETMVEIMNENLASKDDLKNLESSLLIKLGSIVAGSATVLGIILGLIIKSH